MSKSKHGQYKKYDKDKLLRFYSRNDFKIIPKKVIGKKYYEYDRNSKDYLKSSQDNAEAVPGVVIRCNVPRLMEDNNILFTRSAFVSLFFDGIEDEFTTEELPFLDKKFVANYKKGKGFVFKKINK